MVRTAVALALTASVALAAGFEKAVPVWPEGREHEMNLTVDFETTFDAPDQVPVLRLTCSTLYRARLNGAFLGHGPARGPHGSFRIDEWPLRDLKPTGNRLVISVAGYNVNSFAYLDQPSFLQAEIVAGGRVLAATGGDGFVARQDRTRVQRVARYSFQRPFSEVYRLSPNSEAPELRCTQQPEVPLLPRRVPYPTFERRAVSWHVAEGRMEPHEPAQIWKDRSLVNIGPELRGFKESELEVVPVIELQKLRNATSRRLDRPAAADDRIALEENGFHILDFGTNFTGFLGARIRCEAPARLLLTFDEILTDGDVDFKRLSCVNIIDLHLEPGTYAFETFEPYTMRYLKLIAMEGACTVDGVYLRDLTNPAVWDAHFSASDARLNRLFEAGRETFRQNAVDVFMDCPSRERAGWLCDSFFTSRVAQDLSGNALIEKNFYENFLLARAYPKIPDGMLPMCYPSDHYDGVFIPNWAMWFVVELEEYLARTGDTALVKKLEPKVSQLLAFLAKFENSDGLLEKLPSWVFVEWSAANSFVQDVNYPSNALYSGALRAAGRLYNRPELLQRSDAVRETILRQAWDGTWFVDNAVRRDGKLEVTKNHTETCQYYIFFFDVAAPQTHRELWRKLTDEFGPRRMEKKLYPDVPESNSFIGNMLRMELLSRDGRSQQILDESIDYLMYMADRTGTLWENAKPEASCNHGFASHICHTLYRDILGLRRVDTVGRKVQLRFADVKLDWCEGRVPTPDGFVSLRWWKTGEGLRYRLETPAGYAVEVLDGSIAARRQP